MISICIPVYNFDIQNLVYDLDREITDSKLSAEIILIDDASEGKFLALNKELENKVSKFIYLKENIGRSKIRNLFLQYAEGDYLLFLDCDGRIIQKNFIKNYIDFINHNKTTKIIFGGGKKDQGVKPDTKYFLHWYFSKNRENIPFKSRLNNPYASFQTNNFCIYRLLFSKIKFNENLSGYGYEDALFALDLKKNNISIDQIDNPILNDDLETNESYLKKVNQAVDNLNFLIDNQYNVKEIKLAKAYLFLKKYHLNQVLLYLAKPWKKKIEKRLLYTEAHLGFLDIYKLILLCEKQRKAKH